MLDIKLIREKPELVTQAARHKGVEVDIGRLLKVDLERRDLLRKIEELLAKKNEANKQIKAGGDKQAIVSEMKKIDSVATKLQEQLGQTETEYLNLLYSIPNIPSADTPIGQNETDNRVIRSWGKPPTLKFVTRDHIQLGKELDIIDIETSAKVTGSRFNYLKGAAVLLQFGLIQYALRVLTSQAELEKVCDKFSVKTKVKAFTPVIPPVMIRPEIFQRMGRLSELDKDERYRLAQDELYLIGSAEHTLGPMHMDQILTESSLPLRYIGYSTAFRREAGTYGQDTRGILRVHQFDKLEIESFTLAEEATQEQDFIVAIQEYFMQSLKIPYQVMAVCTGDMGGPDARQIDINAWLPGQNKYRETHTSDLMTDYQARRLNTRVRRKDGSIEYVHMNDATVFAMGRTLIAILENYQQPDGSVKIPEVLVPYVGFDSISVK